MLRGLFLEAFSTGSGGAVAVGSACDSGSRSTRRSRRDTGRSQQERGWLCLPCFSRGWERGVPREGEQGDEELPGAGWAAAAWVLQAPVPTWAVNTGNPPLGQGGSVSDSPGPAELARPGYFVSQQRACSRMKPDNYGSMHQPCQKAIPVVSPTSSVLESTPGGSAVTTAAASQSCIPPRKFFQVPSQ